VYPASKMKGCFMQKPSVQGEQLEVIKKYGGEPERILDILLDLQDLSSENYLSPETIALVAQELRTTQTRVYEVASFYSMLQTQPQAQHVFEICSSTPCYFNKSSWVAHILEQELGVHLGETTSDGKISFNYIPCVGACDIGPVIKVHDTVYGNLTQESIKSLIETYRKGQKDE